MRKAGNPIEDDDEEYSGRVTLRMPPYLHRAVAENAQADDMSLNAYIVTTLSIDLAQRVHAVSSIGTARTRVIATKPAGLEASLVRGVISAMGSGTLTTGDFYCGGTSTFYRKSEVTTFGSQYSTLPVYWGTGFTPGVPIFATEDVEEEIRARVA